MNHIIFEIETFHPFIPPVSFFSRSTPEHKLIFKLKTAFPFYLNSRKYFLSPFLIFFSSTFLLRLSSDSVCHSLKKKNYSINNKKSFILFRPSIKMSQPTKQPLYIIFFFFFFSFSVKWLW
jgi:hypothetical protein